MSYLAAVMKSWGKAIFPMNFEKEVRPIPSLNLGGQFYFFKLSFSIKPQKICRINSGIFNAEKVNLR